MLPTGRIGISEVEVVQGLSDRSSDLPANGAHISEDILRNSFVAVLGERNKTRVKFRGVVYYASFRQTESGQ